MVYQVPFLEAIAREAGAILQGFSGHVLDRSEKAGAGFVTEADLASERYLVNAILERYPTASIIAEEGSGRVGTDDMAFIIDPLDGTTNFAHGIPEYAVCIGVEKAGKLVAGVVFNPARDVMYSAEVGCGAFKNGRRLTMAAPPAMEAFSDQHHDFRSGQQITGQVIGFRPDVGNDLTIRRNRLLPAPGRAGAGFRAGGDWGAGVRPHERSPVSSSHGTHSTA